jgi:hypothetical protein
METSLADLWDHFDHAIMTENYGDAHALLEIIERFKEVADDSQLKELN